jgi:hypothetical protein
VLGQVQRSTKDSHRQDEKMKEGWYGDEYLAIFSEVESKVASRKYDLARRLPGYALIGLRFWDDFIVVNPAGASLSLPTLPLDASRVEKFALPDASFSLRPDPRFTGKIRWYAKPLVFGGEPTPENTSWVTYEQHSQLVCWWNDKYDSLKA